LIRIPDTEAWPAGLALAGLSRSAGKTGGCGAGSVDEGRLGTTGHRQPGATVQFSVSTSWRSSTTATTAGPRCWPSQILVDRWHAVIGDQTYADAVLDRLVHSAHRLELTGETMRKRGAAKASEEAA
jgi:hypothetical protein